MPRFRFLLAIAGSVYFIWWFAVSWALPNAFNPFLSRFVTVAVIFLFLAASYFSKWMHKNLENLLVVSLWLITLHFFYLFYNNGSDMNWIIGSFITVSAISMGFYSRMQLWSYSLLIFFFSVVLIWAIPDLQQTFFFAGMMTILVQTNMALGTRFHILGHLNASNDRFELLFNSTFEGILVHDGKKVLLVNDALLKMLEYERGEFIGKNVMVFVDGGEPVHQRIRSGFDLDQQGPFEMTGLTKNGTQLQLEVRGKKFLYEGKAVRLVTVNNIRDRKKAEQEKVRALAMAENVRSRDEFISIAAHELKTPLSSLKLQGQLVSRELKKKDFSPEQFDGALTVFNRQVNRLAELVETMLDTSRASIGQITLNRTIMDLSARVANAVDNLRLQDPDEPVSVIEVNVERGLMIDADGSRIGQVVENLLSNAIKYGNGQPIQVTVRAEGKNAVLSVQDHGPGIVPEAMNRIFDRFERAVSSQSISGLGLGLYITRKIVEAHGGTIQVSSEIGQGSTFTAVFPRA